MKNSNAILISAAIAVMTIGGAQAAMAQTEGQIEAGKAQAAMARGDNWIATNYQKRATALEPTVGNRFDLATGYQRTGRLNTAKGYYQNLANSNEAAAIPFRGPANFDLGMAAADRLLYIDWVQNGAARRGGVVSAETVGENVSATVGGSGEYEVTDEQARALDRQARLRH